MEEVIKDNWEEILTIISLDNNTARAVINAWIKPLKLYRIKDGTIYFQVKTNSPENDNRAIEFMKDRNLDFELLMAIQKFTNSMDITAIELIKSTDTDILDHDTKTAGDNASTSIYRQNLNPRYTFDTFVVGEENRMAQATAVAVAEEPGNAYNPLFLYGASGLGKTHLIQAIANYTLDKNPNAKVLYVTSENFTNELINSIKHNTPEDFRRKYRELDELIIDDIQFIIDKETTQEEFFHTFNALHEAKKQIILSSDRPPKQLNGLPDRLISRFESGLCEDIGSPNYELRMAILKQKVDEEHLNISDDILDFIAKNVTSNIRELEGALNKIRVYYKLQDKRNPIDLSFAEEALKDIIKPNKIHEINPDLIINTVCEHFHITREEITGVSKSQNIAKPRMIVMYLCRKLLPNMTLQEIGRYLNRKNHSTVLHGTEKIEEELQKDQGLNNTIDVLIKKITSN